MSLQPVGGVVNELVALIVVAVFVFLALVDAELALDAKAIAITVVISLSIASVAELHFAVITGVSEGFGRFVISPFPGPFHCFPNRQAPLLLPQDATLQQAVKAAHGRAQVAALVLRRCICFGSSTQGIFRSTHGIFRSAHHRTRLLLLCQGVSILCLAGVKLLRPQDGAGQGPLRNRRSPRRTARSSLVFFSSCALVRIGSTGWSVARCTVSHAGVARSRRKRT